MYTITFEDGTKFDGGNLEDSLWLQMPDKPIKSLMYYGYKETLILEDFIAYNHLIEKTLMIGASKEIIEQIIIMALRLDGKVIKIFLNPRTMKFARAAEIKVLGEEYNSKATNGWKKGVEGLKPMLHIKAS